MKYIVKKQTIQNGTVKIEMSTVEMIYNDNSIDSYKFDAESMKKMADDAKYALEKIKLEKELKELEEKNYLAIMRRLDNYTIPQLIKKLFEL